MSSTKKTKALELIEGFKSLYTQLNKNNCQGDLIDGVYSTDLIFQDTFHRIEGIENFKDYCAGLYENLNYCEFEFHNEWVGKTDAMLTWTMYYSHPKLKGSKKIRVDGATELLFKDKVHYHKDYFDGGELLYEHVPILGAVINQLKKRMG